MEELAYIVLLIAAPTAEEAKAETEKRLQKLLTELEKGISVKLDKTALGEYLNS